jgi:hypothetical protein
MKREMKVNHFTVHFFEGGYPVWTEIEYEGERIWRGHHSELKDLEYALSRIRELIRHSLPDSDKGEA